MRPFFETTAPGDLAARRGRISGTQTLADGRMVVTGEALRAEVTTYQSQLNGLTGSIGRYALEPSHYAPVPPNTTRCHPA